MERLTKPLCGGYELPMIPMEIKTQDDLQKFHEARKFYESCAIRCGQYEDTGLEPEEIADAVTAAKLVAKSKIVSCFGVDADHIRELVQAEKDGLLVVLPCKVGDTVYEISNNTDACNGCQHYEGIYGSGESWCMQIDDVDLRYYPNIAEKPLCEKQFMEVVAHKPEIDWIFTHRNDFGKTVFLTHAEAEAALKGGEG